MSAQINNSLPVFPQKLSEIVQFWKVDIGKLNNQIGDMDLFLLDIILKGRIKENSRILDAGSGSGRNSIYFLNEGFEVSAIDEKMSEVHTFNFLSRALIGRDICQKGDLREIPFEKGSFDLIICSRVLHFSESDEDFIQMLDELKRILRPNGILFLSMDSQIGMETELESIGDGKYKFPDGNIRFTLRSDLLKQIEKSWKHLETPRTVLFDQEHAESTLIITPS